MAYQQPDPFWDFIRSFDPNSQTGPNNNANTDNYPPEFVRGFPLFGNLGHPGHGPGNAPPHHGPRGHPGRSRRYGPPPHAWAGPFGWGDWTAAGPGGAPWFNPHEQQQHEQRQEQQRQQQRQQQQQQEQRATQQQQQQATAPPAPTAEPVPESEKSTSPDTMMGDSDAPDPAEVTPDEDSQSENNPPPYARGHCRRGRRNCNREGGRGHTHQRQEQGPFPFDLTSLLSNLSTHPFVQNLQAQAAEVAQAAGAPTSDSNSSNFTPPLDLFSTPDAYILHLSLPGALKPDVGVDWDPETKTLRVAGVVHRPGDEEFQAMLVSGERRVGVFEREVRLPPKGVKTDSSSREEEIDADGITAKMENGVLIVTVPKVEKEWTEIRKVDIE